MRIAFYAPLKSPDHGTPSGDRRVARLLMHALVLAGHAVKLASDFRSFDGAGDARRQQALCAEGETIAQGLIAHWRSADGTTQRPELWFSYHLYYKAPDWIGPAVCAALDIPYVVAEASHAPKRVAGPWAGGHAAAEQAILAADLLLCPTRDDMVCLQQLVHDDTPVLQLPPFLDPAPYRAALAGRAEHRASLAAAHGLDSGRPWIVVPAMMRPGDKLASYGQLAAALRHLGDLPWHLLVAGDGPARAEVEALLQAAAPGRVCYLGLQDAQAMATLYAASDLCMWPAVNEAYGMAMLEAQAAGVPVVSCRLRGVPDVVRDNETGLLAPGGNEQALADCARRLLTDGALRARMSAAATHFVATERGTEQAAILLQRVLPTQRRGLRSPPQSMVQA